jgi:tRNA uridine 5-carboxymethylaminomethyl modification enzyme
MATEVLIGKNDNVEGVHTFFGMDFYAPSVVLTTGTFMSGKIWVGRTSMPAGRAGESASHGLTENLQHLGFETDRLKTGTPPRIDRRTVDFSGLEAQHGDEEVCILHAVKLPSSFVLRYLHSYNFSACINKCRFSSSIAFDY